MDSWSLRLVAGMILTLAGAGAGRVCADAKRRRAVQLKGLCQALERLPVAMLDRRMPVKQALCGVGHEGFEMVAGLLDEEGSVDMAWKSAQVKLRAKGGALSMLEKEELDVLDGLFSSLGLTGAAEQRLLLTDVIESLGAIYISARKKADEQAKLYSTLGLLAGLALGVLLI